MPLREGGQVLTGLIRSIEDAFVPLGSSEHKLGAHRKGKHKKYLESVPVPMQPVQQVLPPRIYGRADLDNLPNLPPVLLGQEMRRRIDEAHEERMSLYSLVDTSEMAEAMVKDIVASTHPENATPPWEE